MKYFFLIVIFAFTAGNAFAQSGTLVWQDELCEFTGTYDAKKYSEEELRNTSRLFRVGEFDFFPDSTVWKYEEIADLDVDAMAAEYERLSQELRELEIIDSEFWEGVRKSKLEEMGRRYELARVTMQAYTNPKILRSYSGAEECKLNFAEPIIAGGETLIDAWRKVNRDSQSRNADPQRLQRRFDTENASPDRLKYALVETMAFGWHNCVNATFPHQQQDLYTEFAKLFTKVKSVCDEP